MQNSPESFHPTTLLLDLARQRQNLLTVVAQL